MYTILTPEEAAEIGLNTDPQEGRIEIVSDRRRDRHAPLPVNIREQEKAPVQMLPRVTKDAMTRRRETSAYLNLYTPEQRTKVLKHVAAAHVEGLAYSVGFRPDTRLLADDYDFTEYQQVEMVRQPGRLLVTPGDFTPEVLRRYVETLAVSSLAPSKECWLEPVSPLSVTLMLGGLTMAGLDNLCRDVFQAYGYEVPKGGRLSDAMATVGFSPKRQHTYIPTLNDIPLHQLNQGEWEKDGGDYLDRLEKIRINTPSYKKGSNANLRQDWLRLLPRGVSFPHAALNLDCIASMLNDRLAKIRTKAVITAVVPFCPAAHCIGRVTLRELQTDMNLFNQARRVNDGTFINAVRRVFEQSWFDLDLSGTLEGVAEDVETQVAREIISHLASTGPRATGEHAKVEATTLLGMALVTGVPIGNLIRFGIDYLRRTGDSFISAAIVREISDEGGLIDDLLIEDEEGILSAAYRCGEELEELALELEHLENDATAKAKRCWNRKLRQGGSTLWSHRTRNRYFIQSVIEVDGEDKAYYLSYPDNRLIGVGKGEMEW